MKSNFLVTLFALTLTGISQPLLAATINWGPSVSGGDYLSDGAALTPAVTPAVIFELGVFNIGFSPTASNTNLWASSWTAVSSSAYDATQTNYGTQLTTTSFSSLGIAQGRQVFVWGFNQKPIDATTEWVLYSALTSLSTAPKSDNWVSPGGPGDQGNPSIDWSPATTNQVAFGATSTGTGGGLVDTSVPLVGDQVQLYKVVPEINSLLLVAVGSLMFFRRKR